MPKQFDGKKIRESKRKPKPRDLGTGAARKAADASISRNKRNRSALDIARGSLGIRRRNQTTDSNN